ncbi:hypothetical protein [Persicirhabdus sediminis]|uniref:Uncharacterized protein n=1 Tax=Persicirhabdus sediminis TaxID=454144 RepID=A0A8J7SJM5_9BACT|nr:hypothetical protein [Persicirhabdus sediminis]MBK1791459.1 hypothetical protein [Persicirhabdus sediminis]
MSNSEIELDFLSAETDEVFRQCIHCECQLTTAGLFMVSKAYRGDECTFEYAICMDCREKIHNELSDDSRVAMFDFMHDRVNMPQREEKYKNAANYQLQLDSCATCGLDRQLAESYSTAAVFHNGLMLTGAFPLMICSSCEEEVYQCLSDHTKDVWDKFINDHFPGPPAIGEPSPNHHLVF